jgi:RNAse (barnase) inhibitor barstar
MIICGVVKNFKNMEELAALVSFKDTVKASDFYKDFQNTLNVCDLKVNNVNCIWS